MIHVHVISGQGPFENIFPSEFINLIGYSIHWLLQTRSSPPEVFFRKGFLKIWSKFTGEHPYRSVISIKLQSNFIETTLRHGCSSLNLLHIFRTPFYKSTYGGLLLANEVLLHCIWHEIQITFKILHALENVISCKQHSLFCLLVTALNLNSVQSGLVDFNYLLL